jgi:hypothetical protein
VHHALLLVEVALVLEIVEPENRLILAEDGRHESFAIQVISAAPELHQQIERLTSVLYGVRVVAVPVQLTSRTLDFGMQCKPLECAQRLSRLVLIEGARPLFQSLN